MINLLIFIKGNIRVLWSSIEYVNSTCFKFLFSCQVRACIEFELTNANQLPFKIRFLNSNDLDLLESFIKSIPKKELVYFEPYSFDIKNLRRVISDPSLFMLGVFINNKIIGYFHLRFFVNKTCFIGRFVDYKYRNRGIGREMNRILYNATWNAGFRCLATHSINNRLIQMANTNNPNYHMIKLLRDNHVLVEYRKKSGS